MRGVTEADRNSSLTSPEDQSDLPVGCTSPPVADHEVGSTQMRTLPQSDGVVSDSGGAEESSVVGNGRGGGREFDVETKSAAETSCAEGVTGERKDLPIFYRPRSHWRHWLLVQI